MNDSTYDDDVTDDYDSELLLNVSGDPRLREDEFNVNDDEDRIERDKDIVNIFFYIFLLVLILIAAVILITCIVCCIQKLLKERQMEECDCGNPERQQRPRIVGERPQPMRYHRYTAYS